MKRLVKRLEKNRGKKLWRFKEDDWDYISKYESLTEDFILKYIEKLDWIYICGYQNLSVEFVRKMKSSVIWSELSSNSSVDEDVLREFSDELNWTYVSCDIPLSEGFIREYRNKVHLNGKNLVWTSLKNMNSGWTGNFFLKISICRMLTTKPLRIG